MSIFICAFLLYFFISFTSFSALLKLQFLTARVTLHPLSIDSKAIVLATPPQPKIYIFPDREIFSFAKAFKKPSASVLNPSDISEFFTVFTLL